MTVIDHPQPASLMRGDASWATPGTSSEPLPPEAPEALRPLADQLDALVRLPHDWDSYGGRPTSLVAARQALSLLVDVGWSGPLPTVSPMSGGGVTLEWGGDGDGVELAVTGDGAVSVLIDAEGTMRELAVQSGSDPALHEALLWANKLA